MYFNYRYCSILILFIFLFSACQRESKLPDVSAVEVDVNIVRFDQELANLKQEEIAKKHEQWKKDYGFFYIDFMEEMLQAGRMENEDELLKNISFILEQEDFKVLSEKVVELYPDLELYEEELEEAFQYLKYYFPKYEIPKIYSFFSGFSTQTSVGKDYIGIGLDMFLGEDSEFYPALIESIPLYISRRFTPENIVPRVIESVIRIELSSEEPIEGNTLAHMIYHGKVLYAMDKVLPHVSDSLKIGYTSDQMKWVETYQGDVWAWFMSEDLLYSTDYLRIQSYFSEAPFTPELGEKNKSAPKLGIYLGWQIVRRFMENNPEMSVQELMKIEDPQYVLSNSGFRGK